MEVGEGGREMLGGKEEERMRGRKEEDRREIERKLSVHTCGPICARTSVIPVSRTHSRQEEGMDTCFSSLRLPTVLPTFTSTREGM